MFTLMAFMSTLKNSEQFALFVSVLTCWISSSQDYWLKLFWDWEEFITSTGMKCCQPIQMIGLWAAENAGHCWEKKTKPWINSQKQGLDHHRYYIPYFSDIHVPLPTEPQDPHANKTIEKFRSFYERLMICSNCFKGPLQKLKVTIILSQCFWVKIIP